MTRVVIEIIKNGNGTPQYAVDKSGDADLDKLAEVAVGSMGAFLKSGGNPQNLIQQFMPLLNQMGGGGGGNGGIGGLLSNLMGGGGK